MLQVQNVSFSYHKSPVLQNISFSLNLGEVLCVMGESGCGKSTLLKIIYGLLDVDKGNLYWKDDEILGPSHHLVPGVPVFKYVAQDFDLMPYTTVEENIGNFLSNIYAEEKRKRIYELLQVIEMEKFAKKKVKTLSGGQQQRVAIAKALAKQPELLLLDEPFSQIDNFKKNSLRRNLFSFFKEKNIACIVATHDGNDALSFADSVLVIQNSKEVAKNSPQQIYNNPKNKYTASLFGDVNEIVLQQNNKTQKILVYPNEIKITDSSALKATVKKTYFRGFYWLVEVDYQQQTLLLNHHSNIKVGKEVFLSITVKNSNCRITNL